MSEPLGRADVERIAELASLELTDQEVEIFTRQLAEILAYAEQVQRIDTAGVAPTAHVLGTQPVDRPDTPRESMARDELLARAPDPAIDAGLFRVPRVIA
jgi:aspartyl-tRNA(Asn)/glutamyl-tRNA(Gln) amidotransferase subunit C